MVALPAKFVRVPNTPVLRPIAQRLTRLEALLRYLSPITPESVRSEARTASNVPQLKPMECSSWKELVEAWQNAMEWTDGLETSLAVMLACSASTTTLGDQLWVKIIGPASCGKTTLCEALSLAAEHVKSVSTFRGFHSGYGDGKEDHSLLGKLSNMTLLTKDGDTLIQSPNLGQIVKTTLGFALVGSCAVLLH
jgi:hypothetical protein